jgi:ADP-heptose:LPS heptosyltransferase
LEHWRSLAAAVGPVITIAGEVESDRFNHEDRAAFESLGGRFIESLDTLADTIRPARLFVGADTGPTHLAAALGVPTVALFGPTDPDRWGPIGPSVSTIKSAKGRMDSLSAGEVVRAIADVLVR